MVCEQGDCARMEDEAGDAQSGLYHSLSRVTRCNNQVKIKYRI
jgi:hypothetical protein